MNLVNMKSPPREKPEGDCCDPSKEPAYPWGLRVSLNDDSLKQLGLTERPKVGTLMQLMAIVEVVSTSAYESKEGGDTSNVELQITDMGLEAVKKQADLAALYPTMQAGASNG